MRRYIKRTIDVCVSLVGLVVLSPLFLVVAIAIRATSKGPAIYRQERLGLGGKPFTMFKFRSMTVGTEKLGDGVYSRKGDPRVTAVGRFIRATSLDELPQFVNILKGEMSLIGPRPVLSFHPWPLSEYTDEQKKRFSVRPGVTGLAQTRGRKEIDWNKRIEYDVWYVEHYSLTLDAKIFLSTIFKVVAMSDNLSVGDATNGRTVEKSPLAPRWERENKD